MNRRNTNKRTNKNKKQITRKIHGGDLPSIDIIGKWLDTDIPLDDFISENGIQNIDYGTIINRLNNLLTSLETDTKRDDKKIQKIQKAKSAIEVLTESTQRQNENFKLNRNKISQKLDYSKPSTVTPSPINVHSEEKPSIETPVATESVLTSTPEPVSSQVATILPTTSTTESVPTPIATESVPTLRPENSQTVMTTKYPIVTRAKVDEMVKKVKEENSAAEKAIVPSAKSIVPETTLPTIVPETIAPVIVPSTTLPTIVPETIAPVIVPASTSTIVPTTVPIITSPQDVEDILKELHITMDVKVTEGNPSVIVTMTDTDVWSNTINTEKKVETKIIEYKKSDKLNKIIDELKASSDDANGIMSYLNTKKKLFDIKNATDKIQENPDKKQEMIVNYNNLITQLQTFNPKIQKLEITNNQTIDELKKMIDQYVHDITTVHLLKNQPVQSSTASTITQPQQVAPLPEGWESKIDPASGKTYYQNHATKTTQWYPPQQGGSKNLKQTVKNVKNLVNTKLGGKNLVMAQLKQIRNESN